MLAKQVSLALLAVLVALGAGEGVLRLATPPTFLQRDHGGFGPWRVHDPVLAWTNAAGYRDQDVQINSLQFRGEEIARQKEPGVTRIVCMGDSATFGLWRESADAFGWTGYPQELAALLSQGGHRDVEVVNAGVVGYTSSHGLRQLFVQVLELDPDVITVRYGMNDHGLAYAPGLAATEPDSRLARAVLYRMHEWRLVRLVLAAIQRADFLHPEPNSVRWVTPERFERNLERFAEVARERGIRLLFVDYPLRALERGESVGEEGEIVRYAMLGARSLEELHQLHRSAQLVVERVARHQRTPFVETESALRASAQPPFTDYDLVHPNAIGARIVAQRILARLRELGWLGGGLGSRPPG